ncbi:MAG: FecR family protein [bacterium]
MKKITKISLIIILSFIIIGSTVNIVSPYRATVTKAEGMVLKKDNYQNIWVPVSKGDILDDGDSLRTKENSYAELKFSDGSIVKVSENTDLSIYKDYLSLAIGYIRLYITKLFPNFEVRTPSAVAGVRGTEFSVEVLIDQTTIVTVYEGEVDVTAQGKTIRLKKGESGVVRPKSPPTMNKGVSKDDIEKGKSSSHGSGNKGSAKEDESNHPFER